MNWRHYRKEVRWTTGFLLGFTIIVTLILSLGMNYRQHFIIKELESQSNKRWTLPKQKTEFDL